MLIYDWLLCFGQEVRFVWSWHCRVTISSLLYVMSRYPLLVQSLLAVATVYPMSDKVRGHTTALRFNGLISEHVEVMSDRMLAVYRYMPYKGSPCYSCAVNAWAQVASQIVSIIAFNGEFKPLVQILL